MTMGNPTHRHTGFTLIEILIAVAILAIVAAIAIPGYAGYVTKANRSDAIAFLTEVAGEQQQYFSENNVYASKMSELGYGTNDTATSPKSHYTVSISAPATRLSYVLSATPVRNGRQANDAQCKVFTISSTGAKGNSGGTSDNCW